MEIPYIVHCFPFCSIVQYLMFIIVLLYSFPLLSNDERSLLLFFGILFHFPVLFKIVNSSSAVLYPSLPPPSLQHCFPSFPVRGLFFKALAQVPVQIEHAHIYTHCRSFQLSNYDTVLCQKKKIVKAHFRIHFSWP